MEIHLSLEEKKPRSLIDSRKIYKLEWRNGRAYCFLEREDNSNKDSGSSHPCLCHVHLSSFNKSLSGNGSHGQGTHNAFWRSNCGILFAYVRLLGFRKFKNLNTTFLDKLGWKLASRERELVDFFNERKNLNFCSFYGCHYHKNANSICKNRVVNCKQRRKLLCHRIDYL